MLTELPLHDPQSFIPQFFEPVPHLRQLLHARPEQFFIVRVEDMYRHLRGPVPAVRSQAHSALFITSGEARLTIGYDHYVARPGELLLVPAGQVYSFQPHDVNTGFLFHFHPELLRRGAADGGPAEPDFLSGWDSPLIQFSSEAAAFVQVLLGRMLAVFEQAGLGARPLLLAHLGTLLAEANHAYRPASVAPASAATALAQAFKKLLTQRIRQQHQVAVYAEWLHVTPNHLNKAVKAVTGKSPGRWIDEALVLEAKALLLQTTLPVAEVAALVGVQDASYFSRLFKKLEGQPPSAMRQAQAV